MEWRAAEQVVEDPKVVSHGEFLVYAHKSAQVLLYTVTFFVHKTHFGVFHLWRENHQISVFSDFFSHEMTKSEKKIGDKNSLKVVFQGFS